MSHESWLTSMWDIYEIEMGSPAMAAKKWVGMGLVWARAGG